MKKEKIRRPNLSDSGSFSRFCENQSLVKRDLPSAWYVGAVLILFCRTHLSEAAAQSAHTLGKMLAGAANGESRRIFLPTAFYHGVEGIDVFNNRSVCAVTIDLG